MEKHEKHILITGFEPFLHFSTNPSQVLVESLTATEYCSTAVLPVDFVKVRDLYPRLLEKTKPDIIINMGLNASANVIHLENRAANRYRNADGAWFVNEYAPLHLHSTCDLHSLQKGLCEQGIPAAISQDAGDYLCNFTYFYSLSYAQQNRGAALFLHLPFSSEMVVDLCKQGLANYPSLPMDYLRRALLFCMERMKA